MAIIFDVMLKKNSSVKGNEAAQKQSSYCCLIGPKYSCYNSEEGRIAARLRGPESGLSDVSLSDPETKNACKCCTD